MRWNCEVCQPARITVNGREVAATDADDKYGWADVDFMKSAGEFATVRIRIHGEVNIELLDKRLPDATPEEMIVIYADQQELFRTCWIEAVNVHDDPEDYVGHGYLSCGDPETHTQAARIKCLKSRGFNYDASLAKRIAEQTLS